MLGVYPRQLFGEKAEKSNISPSFLPAPSAYELFPRAHSASPLRKDSNSFCFFPPRRIRSEGALSLSISDHGMSLKDAVPQLIINDHGQSPEDTRPPPDRGAPPSECFRPWLVPQINTAASGSGGLGADWGDQTRESVLGRLPSTEHPVPSSRAPPGKTLRILRIPPAELLPPGRQPGKVEGRGRADGLQHRGQLPARSLGGRRADPRPPRLPVVGLEGLVAQQQVPEAVPRRQGQHLRV